LAPHATASLTIGIDAKASLHDIQGAASALPDLSPDHPTTEAMAATGTDGRRIRKPGSWGAIGGSDFTGIARSTVIGEVIRRWTRRSNRSRPWTSPSPT
jgi:hypothetical protein